MPARRARAVPRADCAAACWSCRSCATSTARSQRRPIRKSTLIGAPGTKWDDVTIPLDGTPVFLGCSDVDGHIPKERVIESEAVFKRLHARVKRILYPGMGHLVNEDEIGHVQHVLDEVLAAP